MTAEASRSTRVLYIIDSLGHGGAEKSLAEMAPYLVGGGIDLHVAVLHDRDGFADQVRAAGAYLHSVAGGHGRIGWLTRLMTLQRSLQPDLMHTTLFDSDILGRVVAAAGRTPIVSSWVSVQYGEVYDNEFVAPRWKLSAVKSLDLATSRLVRRFHAVSAPVAEAMCAELRIPAQRVEVIPRGRDRRRLGEPGAERRERVRRRLGLGAEQVVLNVARQDHAKGLDVLLHAWTIVVEESPASLLLLAGRNGTRSQQVRALISELGLGSNVRLLGVRDDVPDLLCAADAFVLPSRREGLPGALLEAMALQVPIVATDIPTILEAVPGGRYAALVPVDDGIALAQAISDSLSDRTSAALRASRARARFDERFTIARVSAHMCSFYEMALS